MEHSLVFISNKENKMIIIYFISMYFFIQKKFVKLKKQFLINREEVNALEIQLKKYYLTAMQDHLPI
jgi:hypothetical protein